MPRKLFLLGMILVSALFFVACGEDDDEGDPGGPGGGKPPAEMVGDWIFQSVTVDGTPGILETVMEWVPDAVEARLHVLASSAYVYEEVNAMGGQLWFESGFIFIDGTELDINIQQDGNGSRQETVRAAFTLDNGTLTLQENFGGSIVVFTLTM